MSKDERSENDNAEASLQTKLALAEQLCEEVLKHRDNVMQALFSTTVDRMKTLFHGGDLDTTIFRAQRTLLDDMELSVPEEIKKSEAAVAGHVSRTVTYLSDIVAQFDNIILLRTSSLLEITRHT